MSDAPFNYSEALVSRAVSTSAQIVGAPVTVQTILAEIRDGQWANRISQVRAALAAAGNDVAALAVADQLKQTLPGFLAAGTFTTRSKAGLSARSGLLVIDLDDLPNPEQARATLANDAYVAAAFISPSGSGLKVLVAVPRDVEHRRCFKAAETYLKNTYGFTADPSGKDVSRLCYLSFDPEAHIAAPASVQLLPVPAEETAPAVVNGTGTTAATPEILALARAHLASLPAAVSGQGGHQATFRAALAIAWGFGFSDADAMPLLLEFNSRCSPPWDVADLLHKLSGARELTEGKPPYGWLLPTNGALIELPGGSVSITAAAEKIFARIGATKSLFFRGGRVHEVTVDADGSRRLSLVSPSQFRSRLENFGKVCAWRSGGNGEAVLKPTLCPEETARALLESLPARDLLPNIGALYASPVLADAGEEMTILGPGWHPHAGGLFVTGGNMPPLVPVAEAVSALAGLLADFDFATPGDRSRALASLIAPALRFGGWLKQPLPIDVGEADASQSGKTYRQKATAAIYRETCNVVVQRAGGVGGLDESLSQKLIDGRPFILLDNLRGKIDSAYLEATLTAPGTMPARVPHRGEVQVDPRAFVFQLTSNGVETTRDLANRSSIIRIRKRPAGYSFTSYPEGDMHAHVVANQAYFLGCVFAVVMAWANQGCPRSGETRHSFREWAQVLDWIVQNIFGAAPLLEGHEAARERIGDARRSWLRALCIAMRDNPANTVGAEFYAIQLGEFAMSHDLLPPQLRPDADELAIAKRVGVIMSGAFGEADEVEIDGFKILRTRRYSATQGRDVPVYIFPKDPTGGIC